MVAILGLIAALACGGGKAGATPSSHCASPGTQGTCIEDGAYHCDVVQIRTGDPCGRPRNGCGGEPPAGSFDIRIAGDQFSWSGCFSCTGAWDGDRFACELEATATCAPQRWVVLPGDPVPARQLGAGEIYVGIDFNNYFNAHCQRMGP